MVGLLSVLATLPLEEESNAALLRHEGGLGRILLAPDQWGRVQSRGMVQAQAGSRFAAPQTSIDNRAADRPGSENRRAAQTARTHRKSDSC